MLSKEKKLKAMGIQSWSLRVDLPLQSQPVAAPAAPKATARQSVFCYCYQWEKDGKVVANMLAEYGSGNLEESNLVAAIAKALPWSSSGQCQSLEVQQWDTPLVVLGESLASGMGLTKKEFLWITHSPAAMLDDPSLKRDAWGQLQQLKSSLITRAQGGS